MSQSMRVFPTAESRSAYDRAYREALTLWPVPHSDADIPTTFGSTHVISSGDPTSPPIVLFHPAGCGSLLWYRNVAALSRRFRVWAVDTIGEVNRSVPCRRPATRQQLVEWVQEVFRALGIRKAHLMGNSFGGYLSLSVALLAPESVDRVILISPAATFVQMWPWIWHFFPAYMTGSRFLLRNAYRWIWQRFPVDQCIEEMRQITSQSGIPHHVRPSVFTDDELKQIRCPTLLLVGDHEVVYDAGRAIARARKAVPNLLAELVPNANHNAMYTAAERVNIRIMSFLE
jgi:pimeloyl-ACP methyl ester carboxylesterase